MYSDFLRAKTHQVGRLQKKSERALNMVTDTIERLESANDQIACAMKEIDQYRGMLDTKQSELDGVMQKNLRIVDNFRALIGG